jgi:hypothetical protein
MEKLSIFGFLFLTIILIFVIGCVKKEERLDSVNIVSVTEDKEVYNRLDVEFETFGNLISSNSISCYFLANGVRRPENIEGGNSYYQSTFGRGALHVDFCEGNCNIKICCTRLGSADEVCSENYNYRRG